MMRYLAIIIFLSSCVGNSASNGTAQKDSIPAAPAEPNVRYDRLREYLFSSDSVVLFSHYSTNMPIINPATGKYYKNRIPFIENGKINYAVSVQERKQLNNQEITELADILTLPAVDDSIAAACFQPRNAVIAFRNGQMCCFDFCFDCHGYDIYGNFVSDLIMNAEKYKRLFAFYKKHGFKYEMD